MLHRKESRKMIRIGRGGLWNNSYKDEIVFCKQNHFDFIQIWFKDGELLVNDLPSPKEEYIKNVDDIGLVDDDDIEYRYEVYPYINAKNVIENK